MTRLRTGRGPLLRAVLAGAVRATRAFLAGLAGRISVDRFPAVRAVPVVRPRVVGATLVASLVASFADECISSANSSSGASAPGRWLVSTRCRGTICRLHHADDEPGRQSVRGPTAGFSPVDIPTLPEGNEYVTSRDCQTPGRLRFSVRAGFVRRGRRPGRCATRP